MKKEISLLFIILILIASGCNNKKESTDNETNQLPSESEPGVILIIEGDDIWVRSTPKKGEVVMKLNGGNQCQVLDTGESDTIRGYADYWYQISFQKDTGWVFGSQTNLKSEGSQQTELFLKRMKDFVYALDEEDFEILNGFIYPEDTIYCIQSGMGVYPMIVSVTDFAEFKKSKYSMNYFLEEFQAPTPDKYSVHYGKIKDKCDESGKQGFSYIRENKYHQISGTQRGLNEAFFEGDITKEEEDEISRIYEREKQVSFEFSIATHFPIVDFYFFLKEGQWYLFGITSNDCSA